MIPRLTSAGIAHVDSHLGLGGSGKALSFAHGGRDEGFDAFLMSHGSQHRRCCRMPLASLGSAFWLVGCLHGAPRSGSRRSLAHISNNLLSYLLINA